MSNPTIILRSEWGAQYGYGWSVRPLPATTIWLHHPVVHNLPATATQAQERADMQLVERIGRQRFRSADFVNGQERWKLPEGSGISYSYVVYRSGRIYQGHKLDRFSSHTAGYNHNGIGIAVQGNTDLMDLTPEQVESVARLLVRLKRDGVATTARLTGGHRDTGFATSCPGNHAYRRIAEINARAAQIEAGQDVPDIPAPPAPTPQPDPNVQRAQAALNWLLDPAVPLAEDGWVGPLTNGADNEWRALDPTTPPMTPTDVYADHLEATVTALARIESKIDGLPDRVAGRVVRYKNEAHGNTDLWGFLVSTYRQVVGLSTHEVDVQALADALREDLTDAVRDAGGGASPDQIVDKFVERLASKES